MLKPIKKLLFIYASHHKWSYAFMEIEKIAADENAKYMYGLK